MSLFAALTAACYYQGRCYESQRNMPHCKIKRLSKELCRRVFWPVSIILPRIMEISIFRFSPWESRTVVLTPLNLSSKLHQNSRRNIASRYYRFRASVSWKFIAQRKETKVGGFRLYEYRVIYNDYKLDAIILEAIAGGLGGPMQSFTLGTMYRQSIPTCSGNKACWDFSERTENYVLRPTHDRIP